MRLLTSHCFFLTLISFICSIIFQYLSSLFFHILLLFHLHFLNLLASRHILRFHYNPHSTVRFHYNISYIKYLLNSKQRFKTRKEMMRKSSYNFLKSIFIIKFLPYLNTTSISLVGIDSQLAIVH